jgi:two-component system chemotaxis response regulator CheB
MATAGPQQLVVVGASAGGVETLQRLVAELPEGFGAAVLIVLHVPASGPSVLPQILTRAGRLPAEHPTDGTPLEAGHIYVAPPDQHLAVRDGRVALVRGPRENGHRPSVDSLFRSAARAAAADVVGVILSGARDDGTLGLAAIKHAGGITIVQDPEEALYPGMPTSAIERVGPDHVMRVGEIGEFLRTLFPDRADGGKATGGGSDPMDAETSRTTADPEPARNPAGAVSAFTCPECNGTLWEVEDGTLVTLRCRVGHSFTEEAYETEKAQALEAALWTALQTLEEKADFARRLATRFAARGQRATAVRYEEQRRDALARAELVREALGEAAGAAERQVS